MPNFLKLSIQRKHSVSVRMVLLSCCLMSTNCLADENRVVKKNTQKISSDFLEFLEEFSDDEDSVVQLLVEDSDGNILMGASAPSESNGLGEESKELGEQGSQPQSQQKLRNKRFNRSTSSAGSSSVGVEKL